MRRTKREALEDQVLEATRTVGYLSGDLVEEVAKHDALAEKFLQGEVNILLLVVEGGVVYVVRNSSSFASRLASVVARVSILRSCGPRRSRNE